MAAAQKLTDDPLNMTVRALLERLVANHEVETDWVNVRTEHYPWRQLVAAAERGELEVARVGRKLMVKRDELNRWMSGQCIPRRRQDKQSLVQADDDHIGKMLAEAGFRKRR